MNNPRRAYGQYAGERLDPLSLALGSIASTYRQLSNAGVSYEFFGLESTSADIMQMSELSMQKIRMRLAEPKGHHTLVWRSGAAGYRAFSGTEDEVVKRWGEMETFGGLLRNISPRMQRVRFNPEGEVVESDCEVGWRERLVAWYEGNVSSLGINPLVELDIARERLASLAKVFFGRSNAWFDAGSTAPSVERVSSALQSLFHFSISNRPTIERYREDAESFRRACEGAFWFLRSYWEPLLKMKEQMYRQEVDRAALGCAQYFTSSSQYLRGRWLQVMLRELHDNARPLYGNGPITSISAPPDYLAAALRCWFDGVLRLNRNTCWQETSTTQLGATTYTLQGMSLGDLGCTRDDHDLLLPDRIWIRKYLSIEESSYQRLTKQERGGVIFGRIDPERGMVIGGPFEPSPARWKDDDPLPRRHLIRVRDGTVERLNNWTQYRIDEPLLGSNASPSYQHPVYRRDENGKVLDMIQSLAPQESPQVLFTRSSEAQTVAWGEGYHKDDLDGGYRGALYDVALRESGGRIEALSDERRERLWVLMNARTKHQGVHHHMLSSDNPLTPEGLWAVESLDSWWGRGRVAMQPGIWDDTVWDDMKTGSLWNPRDHTVSKRELAGLAARIADTFPISEGGTALASLRADFIGNISAYLQCRPEHLPKTVVMEMEVLRTLGSLKTSAVISSNGESQPIDFEHIIYADAHFRDRTAQLHRFNPLRFRHKAAFRASNGTLPENRIPSMDLYLKLVVRITTRPGTVNSPAHNYYFDATPKWDRFSDNLHFKDDPTNARASIPHQDDVSLPESNLVIGSAAAPIRTRGIDWGSVAQTPTILGQQRLTGTVAGDLSLRSHTSAHSFGRGLDPPRAEWSHAGVKYPAGKWKRPNGDLVDSFFSQAGKLLFLSALSSPYPELIDDEAVASAEDSFFPIDSTHDQLTNRIALAEAQWRDRERLRVICTRNTQMVPSTLHYMKSSLDTSEDPSFYHEVSPSDRQILANECEVLVRLDDWYKADETNELVTRLVVPIRYHTFDSAPAIVESDMLDMAHIYTAVLRAYQQKGIQYHPTIPIEQIHPNKEFNLEIMHAIVSEAKRRVASQALSSSSAQRIAVDNTVPGLIKSSWWEAVHPAFQNRGILFESSQTYQRGASLPRRIMPVSRFQIALSTTFLSATPITPLPNQQQELVRLGDEKKGWGIVADQDGVAFRVATASERGEGELIARVSWGDVGGLTSSQPYQIQADLTDTEGISLTLTSKNKTKTVTSSLPSRAQFVERSDQLIKILSGASVGVWEVAGLVVRLRESERAWRGRVARVPSGKGGITLRGALRDVARGALEVLLPRRAKRAIRRAISKHSHRFSRSPVVSKTSLDTAALVRVKVLPPETTSPKQAESKSRFCC